ncbi:MAG TPA: SDR family oxidoreductase [Candidatus Binatia bacterium]|jgi:3-oxoacyl-[acyl-carrier protein] reductase|nr:SDR family oxidoreductase [Candidatus Binatia bacterium]
MGRLEGKVALVTGGASGIGRAICLSFAKEGATIICNDLTTEMAQKVLEECGQQKQGLAVKADVSRSRQVVAMFDRIHKKFSKLDILVNNAGIGLENAQTRARFNKVLEKQQAELAKDGKITTALAATQNLTDEEWDRMLGIHLNGTFYCTREALRTMERQGAGKIINIASICGMTGCAGAPHYSAAKAGIMGLTRAVAREAIVSGVNINAIAPGYIDTPMTQVITDAVRKAISLATPAGRFGSPQDIANLAIYLASEESNFVVGQVISPNGGYVIT